jgi:hypothetical protein
MPFNFPNFSVRLCFCAFLVFLISTFNFQLLALFLSFCPFCDFSFQLSTFSFDQ